jgi:hypothetical protein
VSLAAKEKGLLVISGLRGLIGRAKRSSASCGAALEEGGTTAAGAGAGAGRAKVASSKDEEPAVEAGPLLDPNAFKEPKPA